MIRPPPRSPLFPPTPLFRPLSALNCPVTATEARTLRTPPTSNLEAYDLFLRGKIRVRHETRADDSIAIALLQRAVALDPSFAVAHAWLARAYTLRVAQFEPRDSAALEGAFLATEKAFQLNPDLAEAHFARANVLWGATKQFAHERAIQEDRRAVELSPNLDAAHHHLGLVYTHIGLLDKALEELRKTLAIDPGDWMAQERIAETELLQGRYEEGFKILQTVPPEYNPPFWNFDATWALIELGRNGDASTLIERYLHGHPEDRGGLMTSLRAIVSAKRGDARRAAGSQWGIARLGVVGIKGAARSAAFLVPGRGVLLRRRAVVCPDAGIARPRFHLENARRRLGEPV